MLPPGSVLSNPSSKPQQEVTLSALLPGFYIKPPRSIYLLQGLHSALVLHMQPPPPPVSL